MATQGQLGLHPILHRPQPQLLQAARLGLQPRRPGDIRIGMTPPQRQGLAQQLRRLGRLGLEERPGLGHHVLEAEGVHLVAGHIEPITARFGDQPIPQHGAETGHVGLQGAARPGGRLLSPHLLHQRIGGNRATRVGEQQRQHGALLWTPQTDWFIPLEGRNRPQDQKPHTGTVRRQATRVPGSFPDDTDSPEVLTMPAACEFPLQE